MKDPELLVGNPPLRLPLPLSVPPPSASSVPSASPSYHLSFVPRPRSRPAWPCRPEQRKRYESHCRSRTTEADGAEPRSKTQIGGGREVAAANRRSGRGGSGSGAPTAIFSSLLSSLSLSLSLCLSISEQQGPRMVVLPCARRLFRLRASSPPRATRFPPARPFSSGRGNLFLPRAAPFRACGVCPTPWRRLGG